MLTTHSGRWALAGVVVVAALATASLLVGVAETDPFILVTSRLPRTAALLLAGVALAVTGLIMQLLTRNRLVEPSTTGATEAAGLALVAVLVLTPALGLQLMALVATGGALVGVLGFLALVRRLPTRSTVLVPVVGILYSGIIGAVATFVAYRLDLLQQLLSYGVGDFSGILRGRYEVLWLAAAAAAVAWVAADRFTVVGLGEDAARGLGSSTRVTFALGVGIVAVVTGVMTVITGTIPFLGLIAPNVVSRLVGDNMRRAVPLVALLGAGLVLLSDVVGRLVRYPFELPISVVMGVLGGVLFLWLLLSTSRSTDAPPTVSRARIRAAERARREAGRTALDETPA